MPTIAEVRALAAEMPENLRVAVILAACGGMRRGETLALRRRDIDPLRSSMRIERARAELSDGTVLFTGPKTDAGVRMVHLPELAMHAIEEHLDGIFQGTRNL